MTQVFIIFGRRRVHKAQQAINQLAVLYQTKYVKKKKIEAIRDPFRFLNSPVKLFLFQCLPRLRWDNSLRTVYRHMCQWPGSPSYLLPSGSYLLYLEREWMNLYSKNNKNSNKVEREAWMMTCTSSGLGLTTLVNKLSNFFLRKKRKTFYFDDVTVPARSESASVLNGWANLQVVWDY